jgi:ATP-dependent DNA ligase
MGRRGAAEEWPVHFVAFDLLRLSGTDTTGWPYRRRRATLESVFAARGRVREGVRTIVGGDSGLLHGGVVAS